MPAEKLVVAAGEHPQAAAFDAAESLRICRLPLAVPSWGFFDREGLPAYLKLARRLAGLARREQVSVLHCARPLPEGWLSWLLSWWLGLPYWVFVHGEELAISRRSRQLGWMMRRVLARAAGVVANSYNTAGILREEWGVPQEVVHVVHPGCDCRRLVPAVPDEGVRRKLGWAGRQVVLTVGRLQRRKGQDMLIRALPIIRQRVPQVLYSVVGDGEERSALEQLAEEQGVRDQVQFLGEVGGERLVQCYQQCDLFALPNREVEGDFEGFGMVLVEAQACGKPVIAGASGGTRETLDEGRTGLVVDCTRPQPLAEAVMGLLLDADRRQAMGVAARAWAEAHFDWSHAAWCAARALVGSNAPFVAPGTEAPMGCVREGC
jgi:phosphatidylinositol alpha-1,6-mannosyltransferase